jgi:hypothetical protein
MIFEYNLWLDDVWNHNDKTHQMDPLGLVPNLENKEELVPLYTILGMTKEEAIIISSPFRLKQLRKERDRLIAETDWWVLSDRTPTEIQLQYRQELRDITENFDCETEITFPTKP